LRADKEVVLVAVSQCGYALQWASSVLKADKEVVLAAVCNWGYALKWASSELQVDKEVLRCAADSRARLTGAE
jgi:hypothetical protein